MKKPLINQALSVINIIFIFICWTSFPPLGDFGVASATDRYVSLFGTNDADNGYTNWIGAATNIQLAVDKAVDSETVWVTNGNYTLTNQVSVTKNYLTVKSAHGRDYTFVNGNYPYTSNRCFYLAANGIVLDGFTITNGFASSNVYADSYRGGGGIFITGGSVFSNYVIVKNCTISSNMANVRVNYNHLNGGGIFSVYGIITNCIISYNTAFGDGAPNYNNGGGVGANVSLISNCQILSNTVVGTGRGGGGEGGNYDNCLIYGNSAMYGGGIDSYLWPGTMRNCLVTKNIATGNGGGTRLKATAGYYISGCTIVSNYSPLGGGIYFYSTNAIVYNSVIWSNYNASGPQDISTDSQNSNFLYFCCTPSTNGFISTNCVTNNPLFVDSANGNWRLASGSPCINTGTSQDWMTNSIDLDGRARMRYGTVDMGAYETIYNGTFFVVP